MKYKFTFRIENFEPGELVHDFPTSITVIARDQKNAYSKAWKILYKQSAIFWTPANDEFRKSIDVADEVKDVVLVIASIEVLPKVRERNGKKSK